MPLQSSSPIHSSKDFCAQGRNTTLVHVTPFFGQYNPRPKSCLFPGELRVCVGDVIFHFTTNTRKLFPFPPPARCYSFSTGSKHCIKPASWWWVAGGSFFLESSLLRYECPHFTRTGRKTRTNELEHWHDPVRWKNWVANCWVSPSKSGPKRTWRHVALAKI